MVVTLGNGDQETCPEMRRVAAEKDYEAGACQLNLDVEGERACLKDEEGLYYDHDWTHLHEYCYWGMRLNGPLDQTDGIHSAHVRLIN